MSKYILQTRATLNAEILLSASISMRAKNRHCEAVETVKRSRQMMAIMCLLMWLYIHSGGKPGIMKSGL